MRNVISASGGDGVDISDTGTRGNRVEGSYIGTDTAGTRRLGNGFDGVFIFDGALDNTIGGTRRGTRDVIAHNFRFGVEVRGGSTFGNAIFGNSIFASGLAGIALRASANRHALAPAVIAVTGGPAGEKISGTVASGIHRVQLFANVSCRDPEGKRLLGSVIAVSPDWSLTVTKLAPGAGITATSTDIHGDTSQYSARKAT